MVWLWLLLSVPGAFPIAHAEGGASINSEWTGMLPVDSIKEALSEPLKYGGRAPGLGELAQSCLWENSKITVVREYCPGNQTTSAAAESFYFISSDGRSALRVYSEPPHAGKEAFIWSVESYQALDDPNGKPLFHQGQKIKEVLAGLLKVQHYNFHHRHCIAGGGKGKPSETSCAEMRVGSPDVPFQSAWQKELLGFFDNGMDLWEKMIAAVKKPARAPVAGGRKSIRSGKAVSLESAVKKTESVMKKVTGTNVTKPRDCEK